MISCVRIFSCHCDKFQGLQSLVDNVIANLDFITFYLRIALDSANKNCEVVIKIVPISPSPYFPYY